MDNEKRQLNFLFVFCGISIFATLLIILVLTIHNANNLRLENHKLKIKNIEIQDLLDSKPDLPDWYYDAYRKCTCDGVPKNFQKECMSFEIGRL